MKFPSTRVPVLFAVSFGLLAGFAPPVCAVASPSPAPAATPSLKLSADSPAPAALSEASPGPGSDVPFPSPSTAEPKFPSLHPRSGKLTLQDGLATLDLPEDFRYLDKDDTRRVIVEAWGNPPEAAQGQLGMIVPADFGPQASAWGVVLSYESNGYVKDEDASKMDYAKLLKQMQDAAQESNKTRVKEGYPSVELVGWAAPPHYDAVNKKLYWAKQMRFNDETGHDTLNYDVRILGRRGVLILQAVAGMEQLDQIRDATPKILGMVNYNEGHRYVDFNPKTDKVAAYGLAALVLGGIAAKAGLFKVVLVGLLAAKKFVIVGVVAAVGFVKRLFKGGEKSN